MLACLARLAYGWIAYSNNFFPDLFLDSQHYASIAKSIAVGGGSSDTSHGMSPLYPYFLSLFIQNGELMVWAVRMTQMLAGVVVCLMIAALARHLSSPFGRRTLAGWLAGGGAAVYGPLIHYETAILVETMQGFTVILALWLLLVMRSHVLTTQKQLAVWFASGLLLGLASGFRPVALLIVVITVVVQLVITWTSTKQFKPVFLACGLLLAGTACSVLPFTVRNYLVEKDFVLLSAYGGMNFWIGNHKNATGLFNAPPDYSFCSASAENGNQAIAASLVIEQLFALEESAIEFFRSLFLAARAASSLVSRALNISCSFPFNLSSGVM